MAGQRIRYNVEKNPTVLIQGSYRFFFYGGDRDEPPHIHVECGDYIAKFWLEPVRLQRSGGFSRREINIIYRLVEENSEMLKGKWDEFFSK